MSLDDAHWHAPEAQIGAGPAMFTAARRLGLEGIMAKRLDSTYQPGMRSHDWLKIKIRLGQEFVIGGWTPMKEKQETILGSILVGYYEGDALRYAGKVGTGFNNADRVKLLGLVTKKPWGTGSPFTPHPHIAHAVYVKPELVADVVFNEWTSAGMLRQPAITRFLSDNPPRSVVREKASSEV